MCFSAGASFTAGAVLTAIGVATVRKNNNPEQRLFAGIPLVFGVQQLAEGLVWFTLQHPGYNTLLHAGTFVFLFTAYVLWPVLIPAAMLLMEEKTNRRQVLKLLLFAGALLSSYYSFCLISFPVTPEIIACHITYAGEFPHSFMLPAFLLYIVVTISSFFTSSLKGMHWMGIIMFLSCVITVLFYVQHVTSVWCFFAAILSVVVYRILNRQGSGETSLAH